MKSINKLFALGAVLAASSSFALADSINGSFFIQGNNTYTPTSVTFGTANVGAGQDTGTTGITGSGAGGFNSFLVDGDAVNFTSPITFTTGVTTMLPTPAEAFTIDSTTTSNAAAEILSFDVSQYSATYLLCTAANVTDPGSRCFGSQVGDTFLNISGSGIFNGEGVDAALGSSDGNFDYSSQTVGGVASTDFSVSADATASPIPEPNSLLLLGTGLLGAAGMIFMRRRNASSLL